MSRGKPIGRLFLFFAMFALLLTGCEKPLSNVLDPQGKIGKEQLELINLSVYIMIFVCVIVFAIFFYVLLRFRRKPGDNAIPKQVEGSLMLETLWIVIPIILLVILAIPTVMTTFSQAKEAPKTASEDFIRVKATGHQFWWEFEYPDYKIRTSQELHIPVGKKVYVEVTSDDVVHAFWVPGLAGKVDASPGRINRIPIDADKPGIYKGRCAELCGASHALMNFQVVAEKPSEFEKWAKKRQKPKSEPQTVEAKDGKKVFAQNCMSCHAIDGTKLKMKGDKAPNLTGFAKRNKIGGLLDNNEKNLDRWLKNPEKVKPGTYMPGFSHLNKKDLSSLKTYLKSLK
ncbi:cytochrome c oxidase subunit 2 [Marininema mesophilum]|uniref:Cytochrome c oxidase subunit 2 n=1 Tax=Marininema mesophilum TaxID=1048340 RepID=A0A1H2WGD4_9BACL|nr:cytochrome c oxidase subunit II [Marininema mesophilum]SDW79743.1 cytochrome c oxidase subunit 2 [Marininema mesophilum]